MKKLSDDSLFRDIPKWLWAGWLVLALGSFAMTAAVIWLIFAAIDWLGSH